MKILKENGESWERSVRVGGVGKSWKGLKFFWCWEEMVKVGKN